MAAKSNNYVLESGDTPFYKYKYGRKFIAVVHGNEQERTFNINYCKYCFKQIKARLSKCYPCDVGRFPEKKHQYRLVTNSEFNKLVYCDSTCRKDHLKKQRNKAGAKKVIAIKPGSGYPVIEPTKAQNDKMISYLNNL